MRHELIIFLILILSLSIVGLLIIFSVIIRVPDCPIRLPSEYYACSADFDCMYHPVFECMHRDKDFNCNHDPEVVRRHQEISSKLLCICKDNKCKTVFNRAV